MSAFPVQAAKSGMVIAPIKVLMSAADTGAITIGKNVATLTGVVTSTGAVSLVISPQWRRGLMAVVFIGGGIEYPTGVQTDADNAAVMLVSATLATGAVELICGIDPTTDMTVHVTLGLVYRPDRKGFE